jgi:hypothetical protein
MTSAVGIVRLKADIELIENRLYGTGAKDLHLRYLNVQTYRVELLRGFVLYTFLALESLLKDLLLDFMRAQKKQVRVGELKRFVRDVRSADLIDWCGKLSIISRKQHVHLVELNRIRNRCAHEWLLDAPKYRAVVTGSKTRRIREPAVRYKNKNLFDTHVFLDEFAPIYGRTYLRLLAKAWRMRGLL